MSKVRKSGGKTCEVYLRAAPETGSNGALDGLRHMEPEYRNVYDNYFPIDHSGELSVGSNRALLHYLGANPCLNYVNSVARDLYGRAKT